ARARQRLKQRLTRRGVALGAGLSAALASEKPLSAALVAATVRAALGYAAAPTAGVISASVLSLTEGVLRTMFLTKLQLVAVGVLALAFVGGGAGLLTFRAVAGEQTVAAATEVPPVTNEPAAPGALNDAPARQDRERKEQEWRLRLA